MFDEFKEYDEINEISENIEDENSEKYAELTALVTKAMADDKEALSQLCSEIINPVLYSIMQTVSNKTYADDITQEVMIKVCKNISKIREPKVFRAWLNKVIANETNRFMASVGNYQKKFESFDEISEMGDEALSVDMTTHTEASEIVLNVIKSLPIQQQKVVMLKYYEDMSVTEIAEIQGLAKTSVSTHLTRAHKKIKEELEAVAKSLGIDVTNILSYGVFVSEILQKDSELFALENAAWVSEILEKCQPYIQAAGAAAIASSAAAGATATGATAAGTATIATGAATTGTSAAGGATAGTGAAAASTGIATTASGQIAIASTATGGAVGAAAAGMSFTSAGAALVACVLSVVVLGSVMVASNVFPQETYYTESALVEQDPFFLNVIGDIYLTNGENSDDIYLNAITEDGVLKLRMTEENAHWTVMCAATNKTIIFGTGANEVSTVMDQLISNGHNEGEYIIRFTVQCEDGTTTNLSRIFTPEA